MTIHAVTTYNIDFLNYYNYGVSEKPSLKPVEAYQNFFLWQ